MIFFFSSRRRHTRLQGDWSSDVCSSDLYFVADAAGHSVFSSDLKEHAEQVQAYRRASGEAPRSEEHTSELQSPCNLVCRLLLEKKKWTKGRINRGLLEPEIAAGYMWSIQ